VTTAYASEAFIHQVLGKALAAGASDVHLRVGQPPGARVRGDLVYFRVEKIKPEDTEAAARVLLGGGDRLSSRDEIVASYHAPGLGRFRVSLYRAQGAIALVLRSIALQIPTSAELGVPEAATGMVEKERGLVLVAGGPGDGKSSTMAALIGHLNVSYPRHVISLEDPVEFVHEDHRGSVSQRAVGADTVSFARGIRAAARQDPDVIAASDLREPEALEAALDAAEDGHLVLAALSAPDAGRAVLRLLRLGRGMPDVAARIAAVLQGVLAQRLVPKRDGGGLALLCEVLVATAKVRETLRAGPVGPELADALRELMEKGASPYGMQTFEVHQKILAAQGLVSRGLAPV
jgi:twitching motility protein PilT